MICKDEVIFDHPMTEEQRILAMDVLERNRIFRTIECRNGTYTDDSLKIFLQKHANENGNSELLRWRKQLEKNLGIQSMKAYNGDPIYKMVIMCESMEQLEEPKRMLGDDFHFVIQEMDRFHFLNGEIQSKSFDKGTGVRMVCGYLGIPLEDSIGFGDSMNDMEMLEATGYSICMENGAGFLKKAADEVCPSVTDDGLYYAFKKLGLI